MIILNTKFMIDLIKRYEFTKVKNILIEANETCVTSRLDDNPEGDNPEGDIIASINKIHDALTYILMQTDDHETHAKIKHVMEELYGTDTGDVYADIMLEKERN